MGNGLGARCPIGQGRVREPVLSPVSKGKGVFIYGSGLDSRNHSVLAPLRFHQSSKQRARGLCETDLYKRSYNSKFKIWCMDIPRMTLLGVAIGHFFAASTSAQ